MTTTDADRLSAERAHFKKSLSRALTEDEDPLATYDAFVKWTVKNYAENDPASELLQLLEEATDAFQGDSNYKTDLRYLKLWILRIRHLPRDQGITKFASLMADSIGVSYSLFYEEYAALLEKDGRFAEADGVFRKGIKRNVRALERLKTRYNEFKARKPSSSDSDRTPTQPSQPEASSSASSAPVPPRATFSVDSFLALPLKERYAAIFAPPAPGKRPEKQMFDLTLLLSDKEYCIEEARAKSMGLYGKSWAPPPPPSQFSSATQPIHSGASSAASSSSLKVNFNDDGQSTSRLKSRRRSIMGGAEPTVTINTREALDDVFGMFNSPEKTAKLAAVVKKPVTPMAPPSMRKPANENENAHAKTPQSSKRCLLALPSTENSSGFRPYVDENENGNQNRKENTPAKVLDPVQMLIRAADALQFMPFVDPEASKTPSFTPRNVLTLRETPTTASNTRLTAFKPLSSSKLTVVPEDTGVASEKSVFKVFTPASVLSESQPKPTPLPMRDVFTDDHGKPSPPKPTHERAKSYQDSVPAFTPFVDENKTPFKVFSRPPDASENAFTPGGGSSVFTPFKDIPRPAPTTFTPYQEPADTPPVSTEIPEEDQYENDYQYEDEEMEEPPQAVEVYEEGAEDSYQAPLGGRFGSFNVMTPITERTFEYTARSSVFNGTPSRGQIEDDTRRSEQFALDSAERLAAELQEEDEKEAAEAETETEADNKSTRLAHALKSSSMFRPTNPCNPFEESVMSALLSLTVPDRYFYDLEHEDANLLDALQKFTKRVRKSSGEVLEGGRYSLNLHGHRFGVTDKLGEGGFGAVFRAKDLGNKQEDDDEEEEDDEEDDDDDEMSSAVALKVVRPRNVWEYRVLRRLHAAVEPHLRQSIVLPHALFAFRDESYLAMDICPQGTLLNIVNGANAGSLAQAGGTLDELLVMFFTVELLRVVDGMHSAGFIHGDLKIDNCLLRLEDVPGGPSAWSSMYNPTGEDGWRCKGIKLIDFGRTIDTRLFPAGQQFVGDWEADARDCFELREKRPWTWQTDYFGLAGVVYCLLFGKYIQENSVGTRNGRRTIDTPFKRYWQGELWEGLFDILLNPGLVRADASLPVCAELAAVREQMEGWLQGNCNRASNTLKGLLKKVEVMSI
ncbi:unnamed protein product [Mycena citricolor]|uniref:Uncharacterized protein n=1 Tax=Mycena citricolor TaxID=2018698 RepID=A0AAD2HYX9_9AGAR|nr:unnamed protein product [Mycena citricolor]